MRVADPHENDKKSQDELKAEIREEAARRGLDLSKPQNQWLYAKWTPQGWLLTPFQDYGEARAYAMDIHAAGNIEVYVFSADDRHGLEKVVGGPGPEFFGC